MRVYACASAVMWAERTRVCIGQVLRWNSYISSFVFFLFFFPFFFFVSPLFFSDSDLHTVLSSFGHQVPFYPCVHRFVSFFFPLPLPFPRAFRLFRPVAYVHRWFLSSRAQAGAAVTRREREKERERGSKRDCLIALFSRSIALVSLNIFSFARAAPRKAETGARLMEIIVF